MSFTVFCAPNHHSQVTTGAKAPFSTKITKKLNLIQNSYQWYSLGSPPVVERSKTGGNAKMDQVPDLDHLL